jgi:two-component system cell cycle sensor histidine kinase/response regulator CckA
VISDIVMPRLSGHELIRAITERGRRVRVLLTSGYPGHGGEPPDELPPGAHFLAKPWTIAELLAAVRRAMDAPPLEAPGGGATPATP